MPLDDGLDPDERLDVSVQSVGHQLELAVRGDERDGPVILKPASQVQPRESILYCPPLQSEFCS